MPTASQSHTPRWNPLVDQLRRKISCPKFASRHRRRVMDFTRNRSLNFPTVVLGVLRKSARSIQRHLHDLARALGVVHEPVTSGAWSQARAKFSHGAFIELNQSQLLPAFYSPEAEAWRCDWRGHRLLGVDGSLLRLPNHESVSAEFGAPMAVNQHGETALAFTQGRLSVLYDLLNQVGLDAQLQPLNVGEVEMASDQLSHVVSGDVLVWDRGFTGFVLLARTLSAGADFVGRCSTRSFGVAQKLFRAGRAGCSQVVMQKAPRSAHPELKKAGLPLELKLRFVSLRLPGGELEVLVTSLLDEAAYPTGEFSEVYRRRWRHETHYLLLKSRLEVENWSGRTLEAVHQDLQAAVLVSNLESLLSQEAQEELDASNHRRRHPARINRAVSYHALKEKVFDLLLDRGQTTAEALNELQEWMKKNPVSQRSDRSPPPRKTSLRRSYHYQRYQRKSVF